MIKLALRGIGERRLRTALTAIAILLGVTMISGTYVLTDTINASFDQISKDANKGVDAVIQGNTKVQSDFTAPPTVPASLLPRVQRTEGVDKAAGQIEDTAQLVVRGKYVNTQGAPTLAFSVLPNPFNPLRALQGRLPTGPGEVAVDKGIADKKDIKMGQTVGVASDLPQEPFKVVGLLQFGGVSSIGGATILAFDLKTAQRLFNKQGRFDSINIEAKPGVSQGALVRSLRPLVPDDAEVKSGSQQTRDDAKDFTEGLSFITIGLLAFAGIAVFVGAFIIFNTFSITIAQRTREFAMLRTLGATRRQVLWSVVAEALFIGVLASVAGLFLGLLFAQAIKALFVALGLDLPTTTTQFELRTVVVALTVGILVTLVAGLFPALRATRVPPVVALREGATLPVSRFARFVPYAAVVVALLGVVMLVGGLLGSGVDATSRLVLTAGGSLVIFIGVAMFSRKLVVPISRVVGWPIERLTKVSGRLARENAMRNPSRTAVTAAALMIGLALVLFVTVFANGIRESTNQTIDRSFAGDFIIVNKDGFSPIPAATAVAASRVPSVSVASGVSGDASDVKGAGQQNANAVDPVNFANVYNFDWIKGDDSTLSKLGRHGAVIEKNTADKGNFKVGDVMRITVPSGRHVALTVKGIYKDNVVLKGYTMPIDSFRRDFNQRKDLYALVTKRPDASEDQVHAGLDRALRAFPAAKAQSQQELKDAQAKQVNQLLYLFYALLAMSVIVSLFGIVNTLILSIYERTREIGMMRAIGMTRRQVRRLIRWESVITASIGASLGLVIGLFFAWVVTKALEGEGIIFAVPWGQIVLFLVFAVIAGILAAVLPARRAARLNVLEAVSYE